MDFYKGSLFFYGINVRFSLAVYSEYKRLHV